MKYMGSKNRIAKHILPIILKDRQENQYYVEPFVGGANIIDKVDGLRIGSDSNKYLIALLNSIKKGDKPPLNVSKKTYYEVKNNINDFNPAFVGWVGFCCSFRGKWFGGYVNNYSIKRIKKDGSLPNYQIESRNSLIKQSKKIKDVDFVNTSYQDLDIPSKSIIYCDPPYKGVTSYKDKFDSDVFYVWCQDMAKKGHTVFLSEYNAPISIFEEVWSLEVFSQMNTNGNKKSIEKLFKVVL